MTERGVVIARLVPAQAHPLADLIAAGVLHPASRSGPIPRPTGPVSTDGEPGAVRSLEAIHLATAQVVIGSCLTAFVTYDRRLLAAATELSLAVAGPGAPAGGRSG